MTIKDHDMFILRELAKKIAEIAALPIQKEKAAMWNRINRLEAVKPMFWINEIPWNEMNVNDELVLTTRDEFCRTQEMQLRQLIYQWEHMRGDMVVEPVIYSPVVICDTGFGIKTDEEIARIDDSSQVVSHHYRAQIQEEEDIEKIKTPKISIDTQATENNYQRMLAIFGDVMKVEKRVVERMRFSPWDDLVQWWGVEQSMIDLVMRPEMVHKAMDRLVNAYLSRLDQFEALNLLSLNNNNSRIGSGAYGYTDELPQKDYNPDYIRPKDLWGYAQAQIFCNVSPDMHEEFALQYELRWLNRFGLSYYGCCEPLHRKIHVLDKIHNLRKISMSKWINVDEAVANIGKRYVFSYKPSPAVFITDKWDKEAAREELLNVLEKTKGCPVEVIMKDISTLRYEPQRLWEWAEMAAEISEQFN